MNDLKLFFFYFSRDVYMATIFVDQVYAQSGELGSRDIRYSVDGGARQEMQVMHWTQANKFTEQLTIVHRR